MMCEWPVPIQADVLVIGYGNTLRHDDGAGPCVAEVIAGLGLPGVHAFACAQLSPEHADPIARARRVIFVDAAVDGLAGIRFRKLVPGETSQLMAHAADPRTMLALARDVFGRTPEAWWLTIPAVRLGFGTELSAETAADCRLAVAAIQELLTESCPADDKNCELVSKPGKAGVVDSV